MTLILQVKVLYVRNLMLSTSEATIEDVFSQQAPVERVKKIKDYAFVHFTTREDALQAMDTLNGSGYYSLTTRTHTHTHTHTHFQAPCWMGPR